MGEEEKKPADEMKKPAEQKDDSPSTAGGDEKKAEGELKAVDKSKDPPPPPPPQEIVLRVFMHCEGCARKVRRCLKDFDGVEDVVTDCKTHEVVVKGERADPLKVLERVQKKSHRQVELISPIPKPPPPSAEEPKKPPEEVAKPEEKKAEPQVITVVLKAHMHCEACAEAIKRRILRMKGVENVEPDFKSSQVTVKGVFDPQNLVDYMAKKTGKRAVVVKVEPKKEEAAGEKKLEEGKKGDGAGGGKKESGGGEGGTENAAAATAGKQEEFIQVQEDPKLELKKHEFYGNPVQIYHQVNPYQQRFAQDVYGYGYPQMFSDENPNACSVM